MIALIDHILIVIVVVAIAIGVHGCSDDAERELTLSEAGKSVNLAIKNLEKKISNPNLLESLDTFQEIDGVLVERFKDVTNATERTMLSHGLVKSLDAIEYAGMSFRKCDEVYIRVAKAFASIQYVEYARYNDIAMALEYWFIEMRHFNREIKRCQAERESCISKGRLDVAYEYENLAGVCEVRKSKTMYLIDDHGSFATRYCQKYPSRKKEFVERVKKVIGRYPRWYADEIKEEAKQ